MAIPRNGTIDHIYLFVNVLGLEQEEIFTQAHHILSPERHHPLPRYPWALQHSRITSSKPGGEMFAGFLHISSQGGTNAAKYIKRSLVDREITIINRLLNKLSYHQKSG